MDTLIWRLEDENGNVVFRKLLDREHIDMAIFGHDQEQWATLKQAPDYYE